MKKILCLILVLFLCACSEYRGSVQSRLDQQISACENSAISNPNNRKTYYSYYLDPSIGRVYSTGTGNVFSLDGVSFVMNLDVAKIINEKYYPLKLDIHEYALSGEVLAQRDGTVTDISGNEIPYHAAVLLAKDMEVLVSVECGYMKFDSLCNTNIAPVIAAKMIEIGRSVSVSTAEVLNAYTTLAGIDYVGTPVELFEDKAPENGSIEELLVDYEGKVTPQEQPEETAEPEKENNE